MKEDIIGKIDEVEVDVYKEPIKYIETYQAYILTEDFSEEDLKSNVSTYVYILAKLAMGNYFDAIEYGLKILKFFEKNNNKKFIAKTLVVVSKAYVRILDLEKAKLLMLRAVEIFEELKYSNEEYISIGRIATILTDLQEDDEASAYIHKTLENLELAEDNRAKSLMLTDVAYCYIVMEKYEEALEYSLKSLEIQKQIDDSYGLEEEIMLNNIGKIYSIMENYQLAEEYLLEAIQKSCRQYNIFVLKDSYKNISNVYEKTNKSELALDSYKKYSEYKEKISDQILKRQKSEIIEKYEGDKEKAEAEIYRLKNTDLKKQAIALEKQKNKLERQKRRIEEAVNRINAMNEIGKAISEEEDLIECFNLFYLGINKIINVNDMGIAIVSEENPDDLFMEYIVDDSEVYSNLNDIKVGDNSYIKIAYTKGEDILIGVRGYSMSMQMVKDTEIVEAKIPDADGHVQSAIISVFKARGEKLGVLIIENAKANSYSPDDYEILKSLAAYLSVSIDNDKKTKRLKKLAELSQNDSPT